MLKSILSVVMSPKIVRISDAKISQCKQGLNSGAPQKSLTTCKMHVTDKTITKNMA